MAGCGDVLSLEDLQTAKKHQIFEAEVITGKAGGVAGGADIATATNQVTGQVQTTLPQTLKDLGFKPASFTFATGGTLQPGDNDLAVHNPPPAGDGNYYSWGGPLPKVVPAGSTPATSGGLGANAWIPRTDEILRNELAPSVTWSGFAGGADRAGVRDSFSAFQAAVEQTEGQNIQLPIYVTVPVAPFITIHVPSGKYKVSAKISPKGKSVVWLCDAGVSFDNVDNLCGRVMQNGVRINTITHGTLDAAASFSVSANRGLGKSAAVMGIASPSDLRTVTERDSVGFYSDNASLPPTVTATSATYTALTAIPSPAINVSQLLPGMIVDTDNGFAGVLESFSSDGTSITVKDGWYQSGAAGSSPQIPTAAGFKINATTKIWAMNSQAVLTADGYASRAAGYELGLRNSKVNITNPADLASYVWGFDVVGFGPFPASVGYIQRGGILRGFESSGASQDGFAVTSRGGVTPTNAFKVASNSFHQFVSMPNGTDIAFKITNVGDVDMGGQAYLGTKTFRMRSSGLNNDHDVRFQCIGGAATPAQGTFRISAAHTEVVGSIRPVTANASPCGTPSNYWSGGSTQAAFTVVSDERDKTAPIDITDQILDAWSEVNWVQFKYLDRVEAKGEDGARWHFGVIAQRAVEAFARHGLDAHEFGFLCYDEWDDEFEDVQTNIGAFTVEMVKVEEPARVDTPAFLPDGTPLLDADGKQITITTAVMTEVWVESQTPEPPVFERVQTLKAGSRYGIRYEEVLVLEAELQHRNYQRLLSRIEALEAK